MEKRIYPLEAGLIWVQVAIASLSLEDAIAWLRDEGLKILDKYPNLKAVLVKGQAGYEEDSITELNKTGRFKAVPYDADIRTLLGAA